MNRFKVMVLFGLIAMSSYGQKLDQGSFDSLKGEKKIKVEFDYTNAVIKNMSYADYVAQEKNWDTGSVEILRKFITEFNAATKGKIVATTEDTKYKLVLKVSEVEKRGDTEAVGNVVDAEGNVIATIKDCEGEGGKWGTHINLMGDAAQNMGAALGKLFKSKIK
ncbi:MAG: hypothetical protein IJJ77_08395 [Paludibacteraceae bacterium]|nr:hypothetical protein [Paludibacteraceae bacterium]